MMGSGFGFGVPGLGMLVFWGVIILLAVWLLRGIFGGSSTQSGSRARDILDQRFARGEIDRDEYEERKKALS